MMVRVLFFARARDLVGSDSIELALPPHATVRWLRNELRARWPELAPLLEHAAVAIDNEYAANDDPVPPDATIALIPPVSGGSDPFLSWLTNDPNEIPNSADKSISSDE